MFPVRVSDYRRTIARIWLLLLGLALFKTVWSFASMLAWTWQHLAVVAGDTDIYFATGRGLLNGLTLYRDIFDIKPPAIFLLAALSLRLTQSGLVYFLFAGIALLSSPASLFLWARQRRLSVGFLALLFGVGISMHTMVRGVFSQPELFGVCFSILFLVSSTLRGKAAFALGVVAAMGAVGMKEPFLLSLLSGLCVLCEGRNAFLRKGLVPLLIALIIGALLMALLGWFVPYLTIYLPELFHGRMVDGVVYQVAGDHTLSGASPLFGRWRHVVSIARTPGRRPYLS